MDFLDAAGANHFSAIRALKVVHHFYWARDRAFRRSVRDDAAGANHFSDIQALKDARHFYFVQALAFGHSAHGAAANDVNPFFLEPDRGRIVCDALAAEADCARRVSAAKCMSLNQVHNFRADKSQFANVFRRSNKLRRKNRNLQICMK